MKNPLFFVSLALVLLLAFPCITTAETATDSYIEADNQLIEGYIADGMTIEEIAAATHQNSTGALSAYSDNYLKLLVALVELELQDRGVTQDLSLDTSSETDLSGKSYDELVALKNQINLAMWECQEWQEVTVPQGVWKVGEDIPAGHWTVTCAPGASHSTVAWGEELQDNNEAIRWRGRYSWNNVIYNPSKSYYSDSDEYMHSYSFEVRNGDYIVIENGSVIFTPYTGKPSLGFK